MGLPDTAPLESAPPGTGRVVSLREGARRMGVDLEGLDLAGDGANRLVRLQVEVEPLPPLGWLARQPSNPRFYWASRRGDFQLAGIGIAHQCEGTDFNPLSQLPPLGRDKPPPGPVYLFTGRFDPEVSPNLVWKAFGCNRLYLPQIDLQLVGERCFLGCNLFPGGFPAQQAELRRHLRFLSDPAQEPAREAGPVFNGLREEPGYRDWEAALGDVLERIAAGQVKKAVLARTSARMADRPLDPLGILLRTGEDHPHSYHFCIQLGPHLGFVGHSPEQLYRRRGPVVYSEALAGTRPRGKTPAEDQALAAELRSSDKERREQALVTERIMAVLKPLCRQVHREQGRRVYRLPNLQHLQTRIRGRLRNGVNDTDLLSSLHPTPAVCGYPSAAAREIIRRLEPFDRGLYAGLVGCFGRDRVEVAVGIRSALVTGNELILYAGAGIVPGSRAEGEWEETALKMDVFNPVFRYRR